MKIWTLEAGRALFSLRCALVVFAFLCVLGLSGLESLWAFFRTGEPAEAGFFSAWLMESLASRSMLMALPVLCAVPGASGFLEDTESGFVRMLLPRCTRMRYLCAKGTATALSGAFVPAAGILLARLLLWLLLLPLEKAGAGNAQPFRETLGLFVLSGALWAVVGTVLSVLTRSRTMAYAAPFIGFYLLVILQERYLRDVLWIHPGFWLFPPPAFPGGTGGAYLLMAERLVIWWLLFLAAGRERLERL